MCAGDFVELYRRNNNNSSSSESIGGDSSRESEREEHEDGELWDAVVTCFFMDTAPVVVEYIETIHSMLRPGGVWVRPSPRNSINFDVALLT